MTDAEEQRKVFWELMKKGLEEVGNPFSIKPQYSKGLPSYVADIFKGDGAKVIVNFLAEEGILRIALYVPNTIELYEFYKKNCSKIEKFLAFQLEFSSGIKNEETKWIKREWTFTPNDYNDYERVLKQAIPEMIRFVDLFKGYFK